MNVIYLVLVTSFYGATNKEPSGAETRRLEKLHQLIFHISLHHRYLSHMQGITDVFSGSD